MTESTSDTLPEEPEWSVVVLEGAFIRLKRLGERLRSVSLEAPEPGSLYEDDRGVDPRFGNLPLLTARQKLTVTLDHLEASASLYEADGVRRYAPMTLLRPAFEGPVRARWLLDDRVDPKTRVGRAMGLQIQDLTWRDKTEADMLASGWPASPGYVRGRSRGRQRGGDRFVDERAARISRHSQPARTISVDG